MGHFGADQKRTVATEPMSGETIKKICGLDGHKIGSYFGQNRRYNNIGNLIPPIYYEGDLSINEGSIEASISKEGSAKKYFSGKFSAKPMGRRDRNVGTGKFSGLAMMETSRARTARERNSKIDYAKASGHIETRHSVWSCLEPKGGNYPEDGAPRVSGQRSVQPRGGNTLVSPEMTHQYHMKNGKLKFTSRGTGS